MHVSVGPFDFGWVLQYVLTASFIVLGLLYLVRNTASKCFQVDANFESQGDPAAVATDQSAQPPRGSQGESACARCGTHATLRCSRCKSVRYCSSACQRKHWGSDHSKKCQQLQLVIRRSETDNHESKSFDGHGKSLLVTANGSTKISELSKKILFPYDGFVELFNSSKPGFLPCGLLNCGNSCFANVVLQCLTFTRPLVSYLLEKGHRKDCKRNDWCFLCELQSHVERASRSPHPFSPLCILSRLPNIGSNFDYGKQEDAHEFMRFAIDTMQSVCLDEFGGEKALHPSAQETSLIQHIFGGHLQSQVICSECNMVSNQYENMMDLTVEIQGDAESLEDCLDQFTVREWLHGENMYKCDGCNGYVKASKCLTVHRAPNILTIALKRFQSGRFGKLNKRVSFPETLDLTPYMSEPGDGSDVYKLYAVVVHMDMLNASFFGHYVCYIKDFRGNWCRVDDDKVRTADLEEVLSQGAYMLLYSRVCARSCCLSMIEPPKKVEDETVKIAQEEDGAATDDLVISMESPPRSNGYPCSMLPNQEEGNSEDVGVSMDAEAWVNGSHEANGFVVPCSPNDDVVVSMEVLPEELESTGIGISENGDRSCVIPVSDNGSSASNLRLMKAEPLFSPGFLNKRLRGDVAKRGVCNGGVGSGCNGFCPLQEVVNGSVKLCNGDGERSAGLK